MIIILISPARSVDWVGKCTRVSDGDTVTVMYHELRLKVRLWGIDAPEAGQDSSKISKKHLSDLILNKVVRVDFRGFDTFNRALGIIHFGDTNINEQMVSDGMAWVFLKYCTEPQLSSWLSLQEAAQSAKVGLWKQGTPVPPWDWRKNRRSSTSRPQTDSPSE